MMKHRRRRRLGTPARASIPSSSTDENNPHLAEIADDESEQLSDSDSEKGRLSYSAFA